MGCDKCQVPAVIDGKTAIAELRFETLIDLKGSSLLLASLHYCPYCNAFWEIPGYEKGAYERGIDHVIKYYYPEAKTLEDIVGDIKANFQPEPEPN